MKSEKIKELNIGGAKIACISVKAWDEYVNFKKSRGSECKCVGSVCRSMFTSNFLINGAKYRFCKIGRNIAYVPLDNDTYILLKRQPLWIIPLILILVILLMSLSKNNVSDISVLESYVSIDSENQYLKLYNDSNKKVRFRIVELSYVDKKDFKTYKEAKQFSKTNGGFVIQSVESKFSVVTTEEIDLYKSKYVRPGKYIVWNAYDDLDSGTYTCEVYVEYKESKDSELNKVIIEVNK